MTKKTIFSLLLSVISGLLGGFLYHYLFFNNLFNTDKQFNDSSILISNERSYNNPILHQTNNISSNSSKNTSNLPNFVYASQASKNSIVYIRSIEKERYRRYSWFDLFFNYPSTTEERRSIGSGSGVIYSSQGYIITNYHVIENADEIEVVHNKKTYKAKVIGKNLSTDLALIKIEAGNLPEIKIGSSRNLQVGDWVIAIGNPFNLNSTVTAGIVSAKGRRINILKDVFPIESFIQTDAAINPGNSGGALINTNGELVGINTAILSRTGSYAGYGFAVPSDIVVKIIGDLMKYGEIQKAFLDCEIAEIDEVTANTLKINNSKGVIVRRVLEESAAEKAGIDIGDIILKMNDFTISSQADYDEIISTSTPGDILEVLLVKKNGNRVTKKITLTNGDGTTKLGIKNNYYSEYLKALLKDLSRLEKIKLDITSGIKIKEVQNGILKKMGLEEGFIIIGINDYSISSSQELERIIKNLLGRVTIYFIDSQGNKRKYSFRFN